MDETKLGFRSWLYSSSSICSERKRPQSAEAALPRKPDVYYKSHVSMTAGRLGESRGQLRRINHHSMMLRNRPLLQIEESLKDEARRVGDASRSAQTLLTSRRER
jgi:hypothetical protein